MKVLGRQDKCTREVVVDVADVQAMTTNEGVQFMPHSITITYEHAGHNATTLASVLIEGPVLMPVRDEKPAPIVLKYVDPQGKATAKTWSLRYQALPLWVQRLVAENWPKSDII